MLNINDKAIDFTLKDQNNNDIKLSSFQGKKIILYFYPKDNTSGCTLEANGYKELYEEFKKENVVIIGISKDSVSSHKKFETKYNLPFILLSDESLSILKTYDVYKEKSMYGRKYMGIVRTTFLIDENGIIKYRNDQVKAKDDAKIMLEMIKNNNY